MGECRADGCKRPSVRSLFSTVREGEKVTEKAQLVSIIKCPKCGFKKQETMPTDSCQFFYECTNCKARLRPKTGDCCVFCSYGSVKCPSKQKEGPH